MSRKSAAVAIAVTLQQLVAGKTSGWTKDQELVLSALRRSKESLNDASDSELGDYVRDLSPTQLRGAASNVKGIFHEMLVARNENDDGDTITAELFEATNHPGADIEFFMNGVVISSVQLKAVQDPASVIEHFQRYPGIDVMATTEVYEKLATTIGDQLVSSGISNEKITEQTQTTLEELAGESLSGYINDGLVTSALLVGALQAKSVLSGSIFDARQMREALELAGIGVGTATTVDFLLNLA